MNSRIKIFCCLLTVNAFYSSHSHAALVNMPGSILGSTEPFFYQGSQYGPAILQYNQSTGGILGQVGCFRVGASDISLQGVATIGSDIYVTYVATNGFSLFERGVGQVNPDTGAITPLATSIPALLNGPLALLLVMVDFNPEPRQLRRSFP